MGKYCSDCTYYNVNKKKNGINGYCYCQKIGKYMLGNNSRCESYEEAYSRGWYEREKLYDDGKKASDYSNSPYISPLIPIFLLILLFLLTMFGII